LSKRFLIRKYVLEAKTGKLIILNDKYDWELPIGDFEDFWFFDFV